MTVSFKKSPLIDSSPLPHCSLAATTTTIHNTTMTSVYLSFLVILVAASSAVNAFSLVNTSHQTTRQNSSLNMGIFDGIAKAFSNEEYGEPPDA